MRLRRLLRRERSAFHQGPEEYTPIKAVYICADQPVTIIFRLRQSGGPYIVLAHPWAQQTSTLDLSVSLDLEAGVGLESQGGAIRTDSVGV
jgi:hypothetical protein